MPIVINIEPASFQKKKNHTSFMRCRALNRKHWVESKSGRFANTKKWKNKNNFHEEKAEIRSYIRSNRSNILHSNRVVDRAEKF